MRSIAIRLLLVFASIVPMFGQTQIDLDTRTQGSRLPFFGTDTGTASAYAVATVAPVTVLRTGSTFIFKAVNASTGASTLTVSGFSSHPIKKNGSTAIAAGDIGANQVVEVIYDGTNYQLIGPGVVSSTPPGGSTGDLQYNNSGGFGGFSDGTIDQVLHGTKTFKSIPSCLDSSGNHLNYSTSTHIWSCGTSSSASGGTPGGSNTDLQYNNVGAFGGFADGTIDQILHGTRTFKSVPDCDDTGGNHLNYDTATHAWSCGTSASGGTTAITTYLPMDQCTAAQSSNAGNSFWTVVNLTNWDAGHWELAKNTNADIYCSVRVPHAVAGTPNASWVLDPASADVTNAHTAALSTCDAITSSLNLQVGALSCAGSQNYSSTTTAYSSTELTFTVQATVAADQILVVKIHQASGGANTSNIVMPPPKLKIDQNL